MFFFCDCSLVASFVSNYCPIGSSTIRIRKPFFCHVRLGVSNTDHERGPSRLMRCTLICPINILDQLISILRRSIESIHSMRTSMSELLHWWSSTPTKPDDRIGKQKINIARTCQRSAPNRHFSALVIVHRPCTTSASDPPLCGKIGAFRIPKTKRMTGNLHNIWRS